MVFGLKRYRTSCVEKWGSKLVQRIKINTRTTYRQTRCDENGEITTDGRAGNWVGYQSRAENDDGNEQQPFERTLRIPCLPSHRIASNTHKMSAKAAVGRALRETGAALKQAGGMEVSCYSLLEYDV